MEAHEDPYPGVPSAGTSDEHDVSLAVWSTNPIYSDGVAFAGEATADLAQSYGFDAGDVHTSFDATLVADSGSGSGETYVAPSRVPQHRGTSIDSRLSALASPDGQTHDQQYFEPDRRTQEPKALSMILIPQQVYAVPGKNSSFEPLPPIDFRVNGVGVLLRDVQDGSAALPEEWASDLSTLPGLDRQKILIRFHWRGYPAQFVAINIKDHSKNTCPISRLQLLERIAEAIKKMMKCCEPFKMSCDGILPIERDGRGIFCFEDIRLLALRHVSKASWQPELCI